MNTFHPAGNDASSDHRFDGDHRLHELLAGRALGDLLPEEQTELQQYSSEANEPHSEYDLAAATLELATLDPHLIEPLPNRVYERLLRSGVQWSEETTARSRFGQQVVPNPMVGYAGVNNPNTNAPQIRETLVTADEFKQRVVGGDARRSLLRFAPWLVAAASLAFAAVAWTGGNSGGLGQPTTPTAKLNARDVANAIAAMPGTTTMAWSDWDKPEIPGVLGEVLWNESTQTGVMKFKNLPALNPGEQYQLWIIDKRGLADESGQSMRISGGVFTGGIDMIGKSDLIVPIAPAIEVQQAAAFAITIEKSGGTWVSDMKRRVVIAAKKT